MGEVLKVRLRLALGPYWKNYRGIFESTLEVCLELLRACSLSWDLIEEAPKGAEGST